MQNGFCLLLGPPGFPLTTSTQSGVAEGWPCPGWGRKGDRGVGEHPVPKGAQGGRLCPARSGLQAEEFLRHLQSKVQPSSVTQGADTICRRVYLEGRKPALQPDLDFAALVALCARPPS